jgi:hypothetical protein
MKVLHPIAAEINRMRNAIAHQGAYCTKMQAVATCRHSGGYSHEHRRLVPTQVEEF